jgi:hypothetical protein
MCYTPCLTYLTFNCKPYRVLAKQAENSKSFWCKYTNKQLHLSFINWLITWENFILNLKFLFFHFFLRHSQVLSNLERFYNQSNVWGKENSFHCLKEDGENKFWEISVPGGYVCYQRRSDSAYLWAFQSVSSVEAMRVCLQQTF